MSRKRIDLVGEVFDHLTVIGLDSIDKKTKQSKWLCKCECGNERVVLGGNLTSGNTSSCGCIRKSRSKNKVKRATEIDAYWNQLMAGDKHAI